MNTVFRLVCLEKNGVLGDLGMSISELCDGCNHLDYNLACAAFPDGIPQEILSGHFDHHNPWPDADNPKDHGIRFEPITEGA